MTSAKPDRPDRSKASGADFLQLDLNRAPTGRLAEWLAEELRSAIGDGRLPVGARLPATRVLADELGISRGSVTEAYRRLAEDGQVSGRGRAGTVVQAAPVGIGVEPDHTAAPVRVVGQPRFAEPDTTAFEQLRLAPARYDLTPGTPDLASFPRTAWLRAERAVLADAEPSDFGYADPRGTPTLRRAVAGWLARNRGIRANPDDLIVVSGVAQALHLLGGLLGRRLDRIAVEDPGSLGARQQFSAAGLDTAPTAVDEHGIRVDELDAGGARAVMITPAHQFPTGVVLSGERRRDLLDWADRHNAMIIEDDYDAEHRYDRPPVAALQALRPERVCYTGSVSKLLAPALRIGWLLAPPALAGELVEAKRHADLGSSSLAQLVLARMMINGELERQLRFARRRHRARRDAMITAITELLPDARIHGAAAGLHLMITFDHRPDLDDVALADRMLDAGVKAQPLSWHRQQPGPPGLVLGYAATPTAPITEAIMIIGRLLGPK